MTRLIVHIGPPKTATTSVQAGFYSSAETLAEAGVYLPKSGRLEFESRAACHHHLAWEYLNPDLFRREQGGWEELRAELATTDAHTIILSSEAFNTMICGGGKSEELKQELLALSTDITVVYVARDQLSLVNSYYNQAVKMLRGVAPFPQFARRMIKSGVVDLDRCFSGWYDSEYFRFVAVPFSRFREETPLTAVLRAAQVDVPLDRLKPAQGVSNPSLGPVGVEASRVLAKYIRGMYADFSGRDMEVLHRHSAGYARRAGWCAERFWGWDPVDAEWAAEWLRESNQRFAGRLWGTEWPLSMPTHTEPTRVELQDLEAGTVSKVCEFVRDMTRRYEKVRGS